MASDATMKKWRGQLEKWMTTKMEQYDNDEEFRKKRFEQHGSRQGFQASLEAKIESQIEAKKQAVAKPVTKEAAPHLSNGGDDVAVLWEDQQRINEFGRLNVRMTEINDSLAKLENELKSLKDVEEEIEILLDDDACKIKIGETYVNVTNEEAEEYAAQEKQEKDEEKRVLEKEKTGLQGKMDILKGLLYGKFGKSINLETN